MYLNRLASLTLFPLALLISGCAMTNQPIIDANATSGAFSGVVHGGQSPITGATVSVYAFGTGGYGSAATLLASTTTNSSGGFSFGSGAYTCPQSNTPVYILSTGGNPGAGTNSSLVLGAALGTCTQAKSTSLILNEVTTVSLAYALSPYFVTTYGAGVTDSFGGPSSTSGGTTVYSQGLTLANSYTAGVLVNNAIGAAQTSSGTFTTETSKIYTLANILAACVNTTGSTSKSETTTTCGKLFSYTKNGHAPRPGDTLQAAVSLALNPTSNVTNLFALTTSTSPFAGGLSTQPNDFSLAVSFITAGAGLAVPTQAITTLDIDQNNVIWFPSNAAGQVGIMNYTQGFGFSTPNNSTSMVNPTQVAIDNAGFVWVNDYSSQVVSGYSVSTPASVSYSLTGTTSTALTIGDDNRVNVGVYGGGNSSIANISADRSTYAAQASTTISTSKIVSIAGDAVGGESFTTSDSSGNNGNGYHIDNTGAVTSVLSAATNQGQTIFSGTDILSLRAKNGSGPADGLCIYSAQACYAFAPASSFGTYGMAIDGAASLWITQSSNASVMQVPIATAGATQGQVYLNTASTQKAPANVLLHNSANGGTLTTPYAVGVDVSGNVWITNAGCTTTGCTPGSMVLSEIIGAGVPTITPVAYNITQSSTTTGTEPTY